MKCKTEGCPIHILCAASVAKGGYCVECRRQAHVARFDTDLLAAQYLPPSKRTRAQWEAIRDDVRSKIKCLLAKGECIDAQAGLYSQAVQALAATPVHVDPFDLKRLQDRSDLLSRIEDAVRPALRPERDPAVAGVALLNWFTRSNILRGQRI